MIALFFYRRLLKLSVVLEGVVVVTVSLDDVESPSNDMVIKRVFDTLVPFSKTDTELKTVVLEPSASTRSIIDVLVNGLSFFSKTNILDSFLQPLSTNENNIDIKTALIISSTPKTMSFKIRCIS